ncbi:hypothetical protein [Terrimonas alba]|uniref:hypothetical protein n=1 Tax=Terrimonas alba TaxID=3349636 RepID=UPI0035F3BBC5
MKFSKRTYPILEAVEERLFSKLDIHAAFTDEINEYLEKHGKRDKCYNEVFELLTEFDTNQPHICYFAKTIIDKANLIKYKLFDIYQEIPDSKGIFLFPDTSSILYKWHNKVLQTVHFGNTEIVEVATLEFGELEGKRAIQVTRIPEPGISEDGKKLLNNSSHTEGTLMSWITLIYLAFYHFAEIEIKIISGGNDASKRTTLNNEKYVNETVPKIEIIDSNWFTKIIRAGGFSVNGHFRLQPHGNNLTKRKLIWIEDYEKHGYSRKAKIE